MSTITGGIAAMLASSFSFAVMNAFAKALSTHLPPMETVFFRSAVMVLLMLPLLAYSAYKSRGITESKTYKKGGFGRLLLRVLSGGLALCCLFYNIATIPLGTAIAFAQSVPLYAVIMGFLFLGERLALSIVLATLIGFVGIVLISNPSLSGVPPINVIAGLLSGASMALAFVTLKTLKPYFSNSFLIMAFGLGCTFVGLLGMLSPIEGLGGFIPPCDEDWILILGLGLSGTLGQYFLNSAYLKAPVGLVAPIDYSRIVFSLLLGLALGDSLPSLAEIIGIALIIISGLLIALPALLRDLKNLKGRASN